MVITYHDLDVSLLYSADVHYIHQTLPTQARDTVTVTIDPALVEKIILKMKKTFFGPSFSDFD